MSLLICAHMACLNLPLAAEEVEGAEEADQPSSCVEANGCDGYAGYSDCDSFVVDPGCYERRYYRPSFMPADDRWKWSCCTTGGWMPERPPLFRPFIADPREITYSAGWRFNDRALAKNVIDVSYCDSFPLYGWCNYLYCGDKLQVDLEGCLWAVFDPCTFTTPLLNADYYVGVPITYAYGLWSYRLRFYHISSHVGDEFLLAHPKFDRRNPSAEYLEAAVSYQHSNDLRLYADVGWVIQQDESFHIGSFYAEAGTEVRLCSIGCYDSWNAIYAVPFFAMHLRLQRRFERHFDATYALGYEVGKQCGLERRFRISLEYHDGYSVEGQWSCHPTNYLSLRAQYGF